MVVQVELAQEIESLELLGLSDVAVEASTLARKKKPASTANSVSTA